MNQNGLVIKNDREPSDAFQLLSLCDFGIIVDGSIYGRNI